MPLGELMTGTDRRSASAVSSERPYSSPVYGAQRGFRFSRNAFGPSVVSGWPA